MKTKKNGHASHTTEIVAIVRGKMTQEEFASKIGGSTSTVSRNMNDYLRAALNEVSTERDKLKLDWDNLKTQRDTSEDERNALKTERDNLARERDAMKREKEEALKKWEALQKSETDLKAERDTLNEKYKQLKSEYDKWNGKTKFEKLVGSAAVLMVLSVLLILFDYHAIWDGLKGFVPDEWVITAHLGGGRLSTACIYREGQPGGAGFLHRGQLHRRCALLRFPDQFG